MTRQDYELIAALISKAREFHPGEQADQALDAVTWMLAGAFENQNPRFNVQLFTQKAGA